MSNFLDDLFAKIFNTSGNTPVNHKENIVLKDVDREKVRGWMQTEEFRELVAKIYKSYHFKKAQIEEKPQVHIFDSIYAKGFAISYDEPLNEETFSLLFLAFAQRVLALSYRQVSFDRKMEEINGKVKVTEKFYFKPPLKALEEGELISQLYGRISVEKILTDNQPSYLKVLATFYSDRLYQDPKPYDQFLDLLFDATTDGQK
ncbi:hypothetical protein PBT90_14680 [Algoriphagus halophytocola]|uniref:Uncharacterized protein n=1 Tax=Algoriphagus halophytocola TaxID=2991499 RepID=A0ABY6MNA2_9BACT|nr:MULTISPECIES: hypothetical protein [unclassified Algoriphagus]UZD24625.1 hypothetical protein OM944_09015 [Algoriphagus sp. TR-M5]WBL41993.1 hypothetical protein PBT90_14680 [Algoriphagus sp. TR-M9]